ncbi:YfiR family protein [Aquabacterium sp. OR-4]|uniref:YfiR family protein n=1 Tax=Aquabacterium sp. OR-4 TaxID=2978127 RepID=UPI0021B34FB0|nr:YfiR family protein [Aquabacterium sp. OR-4]MDT7833833.1 YfiR family protein [Aquabacterium sp. OR-4]
MAWRSLPPALLMAALLLALAGARAQPALGEAQAKAAALVNFARYVEWPERAFASREAPFVFCLAGRESLAAAVATLDGRSLHGRPTQLRRVLGVEELRGCHVLFIAEAEERRQAPMLRAVAGEPVLAVGDGAGFTEAGGAIGVTLEDGRIRFDISRPALDAAQLRASANLLRLARNVRP